MDKTTVESLKSEKKEGEIKNFFKRLQAILGKCRITIPRWLYIVFFIINDIAIIVILHTGVQTGNREQVCTSLRQNLSRMIKGIWKDLNFIFILNMLIVAAIYALLLFITNRFWITSMILLSVSMVIATVEYMKIFVRNEAILPADLNFLQSDTGNISTFLPYNAHRVISYAVIGIIFFILLFVSLNFIDNNHGKVVWFKRKSLRYGVRGGIFAFIFLIFALYVAFVGTVGSAANSFNKFMGDFPVMWDSAYDAQTNGPLVAFFRQVNTKVMQKPENYSEATMKEVVARYEKQANKLNDSRKNKINNSTVIMILSESFANPERVPGISFNKKVIPFIDDLKKNTDSGLMLSSGYGGGTANLEYMSITGLSMVNFDPSLTSPYQQLVPNTSWTPTINRYWNNGKDSLAFHPFEPSMYLRAKNYKRFGFTKFYSLREPDVIAYQNHIDSTPYVSDESAYDSVLDSIKLKKTPEFIQLVTMQNHMPYNNWYKDNDFKVSSTDSKKPLGVEESSIIQTYAKGANYTDKATEKFLKSLDELDKPVTVLFYGDHLPGAYSTASANKNNSLVLHLTDYFIWSNKASREELKSEEKTAEKTSEESSEKSSNKSDEKTTEKTAKKSEEKTVANTAAKTNQYSSPNFFISQIASHMNAKVSPYVAFLTKLHEHISAMEPPVVNSVQTWYRIPAGQSIYLDNSGKPMAYSDMDKETKQLLEDYKLIQYDITAGKNYVRNTDFFKMP